MAKSSSDPMISASPVGRWLEPESTQGPHRLDFALRALHQFLEGALAGFAVADG